MQWRPLSDARFQNGPFFIFAEPHAPKRKEMVHPVRLIVNPAL